jgi:hypothetical protein
MTDFTSDWHSNHIATWKELVLPRLPSTRRRWLELGSFEGKSAVWTLDNAIRQGDELVCVDAWWNSDTESRFDTNVGSRATKIKSLITPYLLAAATRDEKFDVIYIDGSHDARAVFENAALAWLILTQGGVLIFDDYRYTHPARCVGLVDPKPVIDAFLVGYGTELIVLHRAWQVIVEKRQQIAKRW